MKIKVSLKDSDGFSDAVAEAIETSLAGLELNDNEMESMLLICAEKVWNELEKWVEFGECIDIEFDTDAGTAIVIPKKI